MKRLKSSMATGLLAIAVCLSFIQCNGQKGNQANSNETNQPSVQLKTDAKNVDVIGTWVAMDKQAKPMGIVISENKGQLETFLIDSSYEFDHLTSEIGDGIISFGRTIQGEVLADGNLRYKNVVYVKTKSENEVFNEIKEILKNQDFDQLTNYMVFPFYDGFTEVYKDQKDFKIQNKEEAKRILPELFNEKVRQDILATEQMATYKEKLQFIEDGEDPARGPGDISPVVFEFFADGYEAGHDRDLGFNLSLTPDGYKLDGLMYFP